jgi:TPR repeat protein
VKPRWAIVVVSTLSLVLGSVFIWRFVRSELNNRQLAKDAAAFRIRAEQGDPEAQLKLGSLYYKGKGVPTDFVEAVRWYRKSAEQGYAKAEYDLGYMYQEGKGVPQDHAEAVRWCRKAAEQGDPRAEDALGISYYRGEGVAQDYVDAVRWYRKAAEQGYADAQYNLGYMYQEGKGVSQDYAEAVSWYRKAAEQGYEDGQYNLGYMYFYGLGVPQDRIEADRLFRQAADQGNEQAKRVVGSNRARVPTIGKVVLGLKFLASLVFGVSFLKSKGNRRSREQIVTGVVTLLLISSLALDVFWYFYVGHLRSSADVIALRFVRHLVGGMVIAVLAYILHSKSPKTVLISAAVLFVTFFLFPFIISELKHISPDIRLFFCLLGLPIGMSIPSAFFVGLTRNVQG